MDGVKINIHLYVILELAIKSVQHDQKMFEAFKIKRPYLSICDSQIELLKAEFENIRKELLKQGIKFEKYEVIKENECMYYFMYRGKIVSFHYYGNVLKEQVERKIQLTWSKIRGESA